MNIKKNFRILPFVLIAGILVAACGPKATTDLLASPPDGQPAEQSTENTFNSTTLGECYNPYSPVLEGKVWKYATVSGGATSTLDISYKDVTPSSFTSVQQFPDIRTEVQWKCGPDGLLSSQLANMAFIQIPDLKVETLEVKGVVIPSEDKWQVGYSWNTEYVIKVSFTTGETAFEGQGNMSLANTISAIESVTVPAGTYSDAFKVDVAGNMVMTIMGTETSVPLTNTTWFVKDIGMVKNASTDPTIAYSMELTSFD